ncbi:ATP-binding protein [Siccirubricoccus sp. KC 17139]|uniref:histidine kinase n=1 Tax=Siccirubricoccus soli TaxID=2899147 RepID=A0ABT1D5D4_9PROT|nr:ATP-binding protein [Siccirubricoccus soli]MCO6417132.1 ATP-binding protein [Siccirubricoccus soli]MCP2683267.1 ATP-binding protein [Siccirubricoccus soli]
MRPELTLPIPSLAQEAAHPFLAGGGEMGALMRRHDWAATSLGPPGSWPQSLKTAVRIMLTSRQPIWIGWGKDLVFLYNDPYKAIIGGKHPWALGRPTAEVWQEIWDDIGPLLATALTGDEGTYVEKQLLVMERHGYPEETYYTFSYSPVPKDGPGTGGIICANTEDTQRVIGERQLALLRDLAANTADARNWRQVCERAAATLAGNPRDLPFALLYMAVPDGESLSLLGTAGITVGHPAAPARLPLAGGDSPWPVAEVLRQPELRLVPDLSARFGFGLPAGAWPRPPTQAVLLPIATAGATGRAGCLVVGLNPFRLFDEGYRQFLGLVSGQVSAAIANADAYEEERRRAEALAELDRAKTAFFSNVSHEFRTPLTLMLSPLEEVLAEAARLAPEDRKRVEVAHRNAHRLLRLVNSLLDFSRVEAGRAQAHFVPVDLAAFTAELASSFRSLCERAGLALEVDCPTLPAPVLVDRSMWETIVLNLLSNAFKFTFEGSIGVSLRAVSGATAALTVRDTGTGIPAAALPRIFERFHRVEGARGRSFEGSGIGLALVRELVRLHGGEIAVESRPGEGSAFTVTLPFGVGHLPAAAAPAPASGRAGAYVEEARRWLQGEAAEAERPLPAERPEDLLRLPALPGGGRGGYVLLADDNADMRDYVGRLLTDFGYAVAAVADGEAALAAARQRRPDLVLSDVMMPRLDGFGLLRALRADPGLAEVPVILLSARAGEEAEVEGLDAGADDYLIKPFSARELLARVSANLSLARIRREAAEAVRARSAELEAVLATVPAGVWFTRDAEAREVWGNRRAAALLHLPEDANASLAAAVSERPSFRAFRDGVEAAVETLPIQRAARGEEVRGDEQEIRFADGSPSVVLLCHATPLRDAAGEVTGAVCAAVDITDRRRTEEALREETRRLELLNRTGEALAAELDLSRVVQMVTDAATELSGAAFGAFFYNVLDERGEAYTLYALSGAPREAFDNFPMPRNTEVFGPTFRGEGIVRVDDITQDPRYGRNAPNRGMPEGHLPVRSYLAVPVTSRSGGVLGGLFFGHPRPGMFTERSERLVAGIAVQAAIAIDNARLYQAAQREIAARGAVEAALRSSEARLRDLLATLDLGASMARDLAGTILFWSEGCARLYGWSVAEATGRDAHLLLRTVFPIPRAEIEARLEREGEWVGDLRQITRKGTEVVVAARKMLRRDAEGRPVAVLESLTDVTAQRLAEAALREALEVREALLHEVNHRVKNSLQLVSSLLSLQASRSADPELQIGLAEARGRIGVVSQVHRRLYQSGTHGRIDDLGTFLRELCDDTVAALDPRGRIQLEFESEAARGGGAMRAPVDRAVPLALVISELVTNAVKYAFPEGQEGTVQVSLRRSEVEASMLVISVRDDGVGLPEGFDPAASRGVGMRIVTTLVRQLRGRLEVRSAPPEGGTAFDVIMPLPDSREDGAGAGESGS